MYNLLFFVNIFAFRKCFGLVKIIKQDNLLQEDCNYNSAELSKKSTYYVLTCSGPGIPQVTLHKASDHSRIQLLEDNQIVSLRFLKAFKAKCHNYNSI